MRMYDIIQNKKNGLELTKEELSYFVSGFTNGEIPDYQASALFMAIYFMGMTPKETANLTDFMMHSGDVVDLEKYGNLSVDKHSTGGVGDKTSLIIAPIVASLGAKMAKMTGRGLGHTGGTVDKLESIKGYKTTLSINEFFEQVDKIGVAVIGQSGELAPADKKMYALRDVTATVNSIPLIASSIMSKKLAAGAHNIVLDVKCGSGAFMKTLEDARLLSKAMVEVGTHCGRNVRALITNMDVPLGKAVGNSLEVIEAVQVLKGKVHGDLREVSVALASNMISLSQNVNLDIATKMVNDAIDSGIAYKKMVEWIGYQGGDVSYLDDVSKFKSAEIVYDLHASEDGYIASMNTEKIGLSACLLGAGRQNKNDIIDLTAGIEIFAKTGDYVKKGDLLALLHTSTVDRLNSALNEYNDALSFSSTKVNTSPIVMDII